MSLLDASQGNDLSPFEIIARAASPWERPLPCFAPAGMEAHAGDVLTARWDAWREHATGQDPETFELLLAARGLDAERQQRMLADVVVCDAASLPAWGRQLVGWMDRGGAADPAVQDPSDASEVCPATSPDADSASAAGSVPFPYADAFAPFLSTGRERLAGLLADHGIQASPPAANDLLSVLLRRLVAPGRLVLARELKLHRLAEGGAPWASWAGDSRSTLRFAHHLASHWGSVFARYPVLARLMACAYLDWADVTQELLTRLSQDAAALSAELLNGVSARVLHAVRGDAGDIHRGGRSTCVLTFAQGRRAVYKPKHLRVAAWYLDLVRRLNDLGLPDGLHLRRVLCRGDYTWEAFVETAPCRDVAEVEAFYRRLGMHLRLLQMLNGRDFWLDNVVAAGAHPVLVDLETLLQPHPQAPPERSASERTAWGRIEESPLPVGILPFKHAVVPGVRAIEMGALAYGGTLRTPMRLLPGLDESPDRAGEGLLTLRASDHAPFLDGLEVDGVTHAGDLVAGYRVMDGFLQAYAPAVRAALDEASRVDDLPVRYILRGTWSYAQWIQASTAPRYLQDGVARELFLEQLWQGSDALPPAVVQSEIDAMREMDIPFFLSLPQADCLSLERGTTLPGFFAGCALDRVQERLNSASEAGREQDVDLIYAALATRDAHLTSDPVVAHGRPARTGVPFAGKRRGHPQTTFLPAAFAIGHTLADWVAGSAWPVGLVYHPWGDMVCVEPLPADFLSGTAGVAVVLADLYRAGGGPRLRDAAERLLGTVREAMLRVPDRYGAWRRSARRARPDPVYCGAFYGFGAQIRALAHGAAALESPEWLEDAAAVVRSLPLQLIEQLAAPGVLMGRAGLLAAALPLLSPGDEGVRQIVVALAEGLRDTLASPGRGPRSLAVPDSRYLAGLPGEPLASALVLWQAARALGRPDLAATVGSIEQPDDAASAHSQRDVARLLALLGGVAMQAVEPTRVVSGVDAFLQSAPPSRPVNAQDLLNELEVALAAWEATRERRFLRAAQRRGIGLLRGRQTAGRWILAGPAPERCAVSAIHGMAAVAHGLARLETVTPLRSLRLLVTSP